jgi:hypothetical protein
MEHREASPWLVLDEFDRCVSLLESTPTQVLGFTGAACPVSGVW